MVLAIAFDAGARNTEICDIKCKDIKENTILIHDKGNKGRKWCTQKKAAIITMLLKPSSFVWNCVASRNHAYMMNY